MRQPTAVDENDNQDLLIEVGGRREQSSVLHTSVATSESPRRIPTSSCTSSGDVKLDGALAQIYGRPNVGITANPLDDLIHNFDGVRLLVQRNPGQALRTGLPATEAMKLNDDGDLYLSGALARIRDRDNVGITSNAFNDMINNFNGDRCTGSRGFQGGDSEGGGARLMKLNDERRP